MTWNDDVKIEYELALFFNQLAIETESRYKNKLISFKEKIVLLNEIRYARNQTMKLNDALLKNYPNLKSIYDKINKI